jgi:hypothetical protein
MYWVPNWNVEILRIVTCITRRYVPVQGRTRWYCTIACGVPMQQCANWLRTCSYLELQNVYKYVTVCTWSVHSMYYVLATQYVPLCTQYIHRTTKKPMRITLGFEQWISCIASCKLYHYATRVHSTVISTVNTRYLTTENYSRVAQYLLAGVGRPVLVQLPLSSAPGSSHDVTGPNSNSLGSQPVTVRFQACLPDSELEPGQE